MSTLIDQSNKYTDVMVEEHIHQLLSEVSSAPLSHLKAALPPAFIGSLATNLGFKLIQLSIQSNGYSVINRNGIIGKIRTHLLKIY